MSFPNTNQIRINLQDVKLLIGNTGPLSPTDVNRIKEMIDGAIRFISQCDTLNTTLERQFEDIKPSIALIEQLQEQIRQMEGERNEWKTKFEELKASVEEEDQKTTTETTAEQILKIAEESNGLITSLGPSLEIVRKTILRLCAFVQIQTGISIKDQLK